MIRFTLVWGVETDSTGTKVRAFLRRSAPGELPTRQETAWRPMTSAEKDYLSSDSHDPEQDYLIARSFFPDPEDIAGECANVKWYHLK